MRRSIRVACVLLVALSASFCSAAPPTVPKELKCAPGQLVRIPVAGAEVGYQAAFTDEEAFFDELVPTGAGRRFVFQSLKPGTYVVTFWTKGEATGAYTKITVVGTPAPPDPAPDPKPKPDPVPPPVTSFRVIYVYESGATYTAKQNSVLYGKELESFLTAKTTRDGAGATLVGWRRRDKDDAATGDVASMNKFWSATKPKVTTIPALSIEVNGVVEVVPLPATQAEAISLLKSKIGEK